MPFNKKFILSFLIIVCSFTFHQLLAMEQLYVKEINQALKFSKTHQHPVMCLVESGENTKAKNRLRKNFRNLGEQCYKTLYYAIINTGGKKTSTDFITFFQGERIFTDRFKEEYYSWLNDPEILKEEIKQLQEARQLQIKKYKPGKRELEILAHLERISSQMPTFDF